MCSVQVYAHRGANALENSLKAFERAVKLGADGVELDVQLTVDRIAIVTHDWDLSRLTGMKRKSTAVAMNEVRKLKAGTKFLRPLFGEKILTLDEVISWAHKYHVPLNIELKESFNMPDRFADLEIVVKKTTKLKNVHFSSFHEGVLKQIKKIAPSRETAFIVTKKFDWTKLDQCPHIDTLHANKLRYYKKALLDIAILHDKKVRFYGITGNEKYIRKPHPAVVGWITDYPERVKKQMK